MHTLHGLKGLAAPPAKYGHEYGKVVAT